MIIHILKKVGIFLFVIFVLLQLNFLLVFLTPYSDFHSLSFFPAYCFYFSELFTGQLAGSEHSGMVIHTIKQALPNTIELCVIALLISFIAGVFIGIVAGLRLQVWPNKIIQAFGLIIASCPLAWIAVLIIDSASGYSYFLPDMGIDPQKIPPITYFPFIDILLTHNISVMQEFLKELRYILLPVVILSVYPTFITVTLVSQRLSYVLRQDYITTVMIRHPSLWKILFRHLLPNVIPSILPKLTYNLPLILFYAMLIEIIFDRDGLGTWAIDAYYQKNIVELSIIIILCGLIISVLNLCTDLLTIIVRPLYNESFYHE